MEALAAKALRRIKSEGSPGVGLLAKLDEALGLLTAEGIAKGQDADDYFVYFQAACASGQPKVTELALDAIHTLIQFGYLRGKKIVAAPAAAATATASASPPGSEPIGRRTLMDTIVETVCKCSDEFDDGVQLQTIKVLLTAVTSSLCDVNESSLLLAVRACFHIHLISKNPINKVTTKAALTQMVSAVLAKMEASDTASKSSNDRLDSAAIVVDEGGAASGTTQFASVAHKDAFLLFRALCKLSMKGLHDDSHSGVQADAVALQNKILSLELILHLLLRSGPTFRSGDRFVHVIRHYLCVSLLGNCTSQVGQVTDLSLQIFVALMEGFKDHLKSELEVFFTSVFLRILESENSTYEHKLRVLDVFHSICRDPKTLVEIFINYDCDLDAIDLFRRIVDGFARTTKNPNLTSRMGIDFISSSSSRKIQIEEQNIRRAGLEGFVSILRSLMRSKGIEDSAHDSSASPLAIGGGLVSDTTAHDEETSGNAESASEAVTFAGIGDAVTTYDRKQRVQEEISNGILRFNLSSKKGLAYLAGLDHIQMTGKSVAAFFHHYEDRLDKSVLGDFLGREKEYENGFCIEVLHEYVEMIDFAGMEFDLAIRHFLSGFRLPGEAQKIDRIMEKFAERYYLQNQDKFASADMAFILAFSTIMLQTNLHNPAIREDKRMTKEEFIKQNTKISDDGELSVDMLMEIYDRIAAQPISMTQDDKQNKKLKKEEQSSFAVFQVSSDKRRYDAFNDERKEIVRAGEAMFKKNSKSTNKVFLRRTSLPPQDDAYLGPMFEVTWAPVLGVLSQVLETTDDPTMINLCLLGFDHAIRLACRIDSATCRSTYINGLLKFTALGSLKEMKHKHIESIKVLVNITMSEGDFFEDDWVQVLQSISQLARLQLLATGAHSDDMFFGNSLSSRSLDSTDSFTKLFVGPSKAESVRIVEQENAQLLVGEIDPVVVDQILLSSKNLSDEAVQHFVRALCTVSFQEITSNMNSLRGKTSVLDESTTPRIFSLQKLVEVADFNMTSRSRIAWANMWELLAQHFTAIGIHENQRLAMYAIDSLKQLSIKFLQKEELSNFNFQRVFLRPFEFIMARSRSADIKDLILRCVDAMILTCSTNIRSGWRTIFSIFEASAAQDNADVTKLAFEILERLMANEHMLIFDFVDLMNCLVKFMSGTNTAAALRALSHLSTCANHLADENQGGALNSHKAHSSSDANAVCGEDDGVFRAWWPLLLGLSTRVSDSRLPVRLQALDTLHSVLRDFGGVFSAQAWAVIFRGVLFPIMDSGKTDNPQQSLSRWPSERKIYGELLETNDWIGSMASKVLSKCLDLFLVFKSRHGNATLVLPDLLTMIEGCICQDTESLAIIGIQAYRELLGLLGDSGQIDEDSLNAITTSVSKSLMRNLCFDFGPCGELVPSRKMKNEVSAFCLHCCIARPAHLTTHTATNLHVIPPLFLPGHFLISHRRTIFVLTRYAIDDRFVDRRKSSANLASSLCRNNVLNGGNASPGGFDSRHLQRALCSTAQRAPQKSHGGASRIVLARTII